MTVSPDPSRLQPPPPWQVGPSSWDFCRPLVMGVLNATPDSFSDGGDYFGVEPALARAHEMVAEGADLIDLGGASSHPRAAPVSTKEELKRVQPIVERLVREISLPLSIDTQKPEVAEVCLQLGARLINDVSGLTDLEMARVAARHGVPLVIMFNNFALPRPPGSLPLLEAASAFFRERIAAAGAEGATRLILDPGYGFGKTLEENLELLRGLSGLLDLNRPLLICTSRKGSLGRITGERDPRQRLAGTLTSTLYAVEQGAHMIRVHDVRAFIQSLRTQQALRGDP